MSKSFKEIYNHNFNRISRIENKINDFQKKKDVCNERIRKLVVNWIRKNHKEWLDNTGEGEPWITVYPFKTKVDVEVFKFIETENGVASHLENYTIKTSEL